MLLRAASRPDRHRRPRAHKRLKRELRGGRSEARVDRQAARDEPADAAAAPQGEGVLFNDVLDELRFRAAKSYLAQRDIAATEVAYLLGFAEQSSFNRAFKRWAGQTPTEYRRQATAG